MVVDTIDSAAAIVSTSIGVWWVDFNTIGSTFIIIIRIGHA